MARSDPSALPPSSDALPPSLDADLDDVLSLLPLLGTHPHLADRVFARLVDHLCEALIHDIRVRYERREVDRPSYMAEMCRTVVALQQRGLLPNGLPPSR